MQNLSELTKRLIEGQVEFVLVGGFAAVAHGVTLVTRDVDVCRRFSEANLMRIQKALTALHPEYRMKTGMALELTPEICGRLKNLYLKTDLGAVDCLSEVLGVGDYEAVLSRSVEVDLPAGQCRIIDIDALIDAKKAMNRDHDKITVKHLIEIKKQQTQN